MCPKPNHSIVMTNKWHHTGSDFTCSDVQHLQISPKNECLHLQRIGRNLSAWPPIYSPQQSSAVCVNFYQLIGSDILHKCLLNALNSVKGGRFIRKNEDSRVQTADFIVNTHFYQLQSVHARGPSECNQLASLSSHWCAPVLPIRKRATVTKVISVLQTRYRPE